MKFCRQVALTAAFNVLLGLTTVLIQREQSRQKKVAAATFWYLKSKRKRREYAVKELWMIPMNQHYWERTVPTLGGRHFKKKFRIERETFDYILERIEPYIRREDTVMRRAISPAKRLAITIYWLKSGCDYDAVATSFGVGVSTIGPLIKEVCLVIGKVFGAECIQLPTLETDLEQVVQGFANRWNFPGAVGALDSTHIPIMTPREYPEDYFNYKGWRSVHLLALVDDKYVFRYVNIGSAGKNGDSHVFAQSSLSQEETRHCMFPEDKCWHILADGAFTLSKWMMKPYAELRGHALSETEFEFNYRLSRARMVVEGAYGRLKARWRCLLKGVEVQIEDVPTVVYACCILHNLCETRGDHVPQSWLKEIQGALRNQQQPEEIVDDGVRVDRDAKTKRDRLAQALFEDDFFREM